MNDWLGELIDYFGDCEDAAAWLLEPQPELGGRTPMEAVRDGDQAEVSALVEILTD